MSDSRTTDHTAKLARIREVAMTVREAKNAGEIADAAGVARNTAEKYLTQLVEADKLATIQRGRETCYYPDPIDPLPKLSIRKLEHIYFIDRCIQPCRTQLGGQNIVEACI